MSKKEKTALVPKLRFPEFVDSGGWSISKLGNISEPIEKRAGTKKYTLLSVTAGTGLVSQLEKFGREIAGNAYKNYYVIQQGDFAYNKSSTKQFPEGYISMLTEYEEGAVPNSIFTCFRITDKECFSKIFDHLFQFNIHGVWLRKFIAVGARSHGSLNIDDKYLWELPVALPKYAEQKKIADCLSSLDDLITAEDKKLLALKAHKKGLMQKLLAQEIRFNDSANKKFPDWHEKKISDICIPKGIVRGPFGGALKKEFFVLSGYKVYEQRNAIYQSSAIGNYYISGERYNNMKRFSISKNDFIVSCSGTIGKIFRIPEEFEAGIINQALLKLTVNDKMCDFNYFYQYFTWSEFQQTIIDSTQGGAMQNMIGMDLFKQTNMHLPSLPEQKKIADCLSTVDALINAQTQKIEALKAHKKGLMQGLFPSIEEVEM